MNSPPRPPTDDGPTPLPFGIVAVGASAGGLRALQAVLGPLPADFPAPVVVVQHLDRRHRSHMAEILGHHTALQVVQAAEGTRIVGGTVYIAAPGRHLLVDQGGVLTESDTERVRFVRPSVDVLFGSVAAVYAARAIGVVLTGTGSDGAAGVEAIDHHGGTVIVQDEETAEFSGMPHAARATGGADLVLPLGGIAPALLRLVSPGGSTDD